MHHLAGTVILAAACLPLVSTADDWRLTGVDRFGFPEAGYRSQGVASDGAAWYFSWRYGLERVAPGGAVMARNFSIFPPRTGIPAEIAALGGNHVGDIDVAGGKLYVPVEDAPSFMHPFIAVYDAATLAYTGIAHHLPQGDQPDGVPWVAIDASSALAYTAAWDPTPRLNVHRLPDFGTLGYLRLGRPIGRLQGAKVLGDFLYASSDNAAKSVYRISRSDGSIVEVAQLARVHDLQDGAPHEIEGLAVRRDAAGDHLDILLTHGDPHQILSATIWLFHFTQAPAPPVSP